MAALVIAEHDNNTLKGGTANAVTAAAKMGGDVHVLVAGSGAKGAADAASKLTPPKEPKLKDPKQFKYIGKPLKRLDTADKTTGKTVFGIDVKLPGMLYASLAQCPVLGGKVDVPREEPLRRELEDFVDAVRTGRSPGVTGRDGRDALALATRVAEKIAASRLRSTQALL